MLSSSLEWLTMPTWATSIQFTFPSSPMVPTTVAGVGGRSSRPQPTASSVARIPVVHMVIISVFITNLLNLECPFHFTLQKYENYLTRDYLFY